MPKPKRKRQATLYREGTPPTPEWLDKHEVERIEAPRIPGFDNGNVQTVRVVNRSGHWRRSGWIDEDQARALDAWERLNDQAHLEGVKARNYAEPRGAGADGCRPEHIGMARRRLGMVNQALIESVGAKTSRSVWVWLTTSDAIDYGQFDTGPRDGKVRVQSMVRRVADRLMEMRI